MPGTAWAVDYASNRIVVHADSTVSATDWSRMSGLAEEIGSFVHMRRTGGTLSTRLNGADPIFARNGRCSAGFNVTDGRAGFRPDSRSLRSTRNHLVPGRDRYPATRHHDGKRFPAATSRSSSTGTPRPPARGASSVSVVTRR